MYTTRGIAGRGGATPADEAVSIGPEGGGKVREAGEAVDAGGEALLDRG